MLDIKASNILDECFYFVLMTFSRFHKHTHTHAGCFFLHCCFVQPTREMKTKINADKTASSSSLLFFFHFLIDRPFWNDAFDFIRKQEKERQKLRRKFSPKLV